MASLAQNMGVDHRGADVFVPQEFLDHPYVIPACEQVSGKGVAEGMHPTCLTSQAF